MPLRGKRWRHVIISTLNSWLPGDPRGFRSRRHKIHSSGDYKNPPPPGEHAGLHAYARSISGPPLVIPDDLRSVVGRAMLAKLRKLEHRVLAISVAATHAHLLIELPEALKEVKHVIGQCKTVSSHSIRARLPGRVWGAGGTYKPVNDEGHHREVYLYILDQEDAWTWSFEDDAEGQESDVNNAPTPQGESSSPGDSQELTHESPPQLAP